MVVVWQFDNLAQSLQSLSFMPDPQPRQGGYMEHRPQGKSWVFMRFPHLLMPTSATMRDNDRRLMAASRAFDVNNDDKSNAVPSVPSEKGDCGQ